ncbi:LysR family transcriptional regulator [Arhodomonas aquaeolei]|uniref:LysR family transcriptional regulator n=1 Tax=Arhodomonas aquaeolei TaxID=2369 RepID=UPI000376638B|nr:LysR family transcriptional regulator [Arhodomonas aquaeolei]
MRKFDWQDLQHFLALAHGGSLSGAARALGVDHATVSRRIAALEAALDVKLVHRLPRSVRLTREGEALLDRAALAERGMVQLGHYLDARAGAATTEVRVSASPAVATRLVAPSLPAFHRDHPEITLTLAVTPEIAQLDRGEAELAIRLVEPTEGELLARRAGSMAFGLYGPPGYAARPGAEWSFIGYDDTYEHVTQQQWLRSVVGNRPVVFRSSDLLAQQEAAAAGLGAVSLPRFIGDADDRLVRLPQQQPHPSAPIWLVTYPDLFRAPPVAAVMAFLAGIVAEHCPRED